VIGYSNQPEIEVNLDACKAGGVKVLKRCSGGGTVLQGPGCLSYALILKISGHEALKTISGANQYIMERHCAMVEELTGKAVKIEGHTDLAIEGRKFSGNAQRRKRKSLLFHGTFLLNFELSQMENILRMPSKEPAYRQGRSHTDFLMNLELDAGIVKAALRRAWQAEETW
jgi:lipoate-protein ligase A